MALKYIVAKSVKAYAKSKGKSATPKWLEYLDNQVIKTIDDALMDAPAGRTRKAKTENTPTA